MCEIVPEQTEIVTCAEYPEVRRAIGAQSGEVSGSSKDGPKRWAESSQVMGKGAGIPFR